MLILLSKIILFCLVISINMIFICPDKYYYLNKIEVIDSIIDEKKNIKQPYLTDDYLGYIEIKRLGIKNLITFGTNNEVLDKNLVGLHKNSVNLDEIGNIILAGHNNHKVFHNLLQIKLGDIITLTTHNSCYMFRVIKTKICDLNDYSYYKSNDNKKIITLITCYSNNNYRFVIIGELY